MRKVSIGLVLNDVSVKSFSSGEVWGEEIDAIGMRKALTKLYSVDRVSILPASSTYLTTAEIARFDYLIHFSTSSSPVEGVCNILFFQEYYNFDKTNFDNHRKKFDYTITNSRAIADFESDIIYFPLATDTTLYKPHMYREEYKSEVCFIGNRRMRSKEKYESYLQPCFKFDLAIYGRGWGDKDDAEISRLGDTFQGDWETHLYKDAHNFWRGVKPIEDGPYIYGSSQIALSIHNHAYSDKFGLVLNRPFHAIACGKVVISDYFKELENLLPDGDGIVYTDGGIDMSNKIRKLLKDNRLRDSISRSGAKRVEAFHTWDKRVEIISNLLNI